MTRALFDVHTHFLPARMLRKVWAYFDEPPAPLRPRVRELGLAGRVLLGSEDWLAAVCWDNAARLFPGVADLGGRPGGAGLSG
nr:hypothetical protein GCM10020063_067940 [Dactylosporangium thailandense]